MSLRYTLAVSTRILYAANVGTKAQRHLAKAQEHSAYVFYFEGYVRTLTYSIFSVHKQE